MDDERDTSLEEIGEIETLRNELVPPAALESRVVDALRQEGLIRTAPRFSWPLRIAASLVVFVLGAAAGHYVLPLRLTAPQAAKAQPRYLLLLSGDVAPAADGSTRATEYGNWARSLGARGIAISGEELSAHAEIISNQRGATFPDLTTAGGYFLIEARDDRAAAELARTCPHIKYGGTIVIRRIQ
jgi:hypothetical protein